MIWVWITLTLAVTAFLLRNKNIAPHNFLWAFMPIDKYGVDFFGFLLKPVYIYSMLLIFYAVVSRKYRVKITSSVLFPTSAFCILVVISALLRGNASLVGDIKMYGILVFLFILATCTLSMIEGRDDLRQIRDVIIAAAVGYGIVFLSLNVLINLGVQLPAVREVGVWNDSIINTFKTVVNGRISVAYRLRGFYVDPNASTLFMIAGFACLLGDWIQNGKHFRNIVYSLIIIANIVLTSSRSALVVLFIVIAIYVARAIFSRTQSKPKIIFASVSLIAVFAVCVVFIYSNSTFSYVYDKLIAGYTNRSGLRDEMGRFTIWKESLATLNSGNWFCGHGIGNLPQLVDANRDAHNTYIEVICSSGVIVGIAFILLVFYPLISSVVKCITDKNKIQYISTFAIAYLSICIMLTAISNIASVYLVYMACLLFIIPGCLEDEENRNPAVLSQEADLM